MTTCLGIYVFSYFPFGIEVRMWDLIVSVPDHCLSFYFRPTSTHLVINDLSFISEKDCFSLNMFTQHAYLFPFYPFFLVVHEC